MLHVLRFFFRKTKLTDELEQKNVCAYFQFFHSLLILLLYSRAPDLCGRRFLSSNCFIVVVSSLFSASEFF